MNWQVTEYVGGNPMDGQSLVIVGTGEDFLASGGGHDVDLVTCGRLRQRQCTHLGFDAAGTRPVAIADVRDSHCLTVRHNGSTMSLGHPAARTLVFVHAHPDDEALLTAGTMARAVAEGHRVVLIVATDGAAGLSSAAFAQDLAAHRHAELSHSAHVLGVHRLVNLGYPDSGLTGQVEGGFATHSVFTVAKVLAAVVDEESADVVVGYDPSGGYGHPDHLQVHHAVRAACVLARKQVQLFEATLPREPIVRAVRAAVTLHLTPSDFDPAEFAHAWTPAAHITHRVNVRPYLRQKRQSLKAHASQASADGTVRTLGVLARLPGAIAAPILGTEYYVRVAHSSRTTSGVSLPS